MEGGVLFCSMCTSREADCACICQFPLPALCASADCRDAHTNKKKTLAHYFLPTAARDFIDARNHVCCSQWIVALHNKQAKLSESLCELDAAITSIEESYLRVVSSLAALKDQYIAEVNRLKEAATEAFKCAVSETTLNAINSNYIPQSDITHWIWRMASRPEEDNFPLFESQISEIEEEEIGLILNVKVNSAFQSLKCWHLDSSGDGSKAKRKELERVKAEKPERRVEEYRRTHSLCEGVIVSKMLSKSSSGKVLGEEEITPTQVEWSTPKGQVEAEISEPRPEGTPQESNLLSAEARSTEDQEDDLLTVRTLRLSSKRRECKTCGTLIAASEGLICPCQCRNCFFQTIFSASFTVSCPYCRAPFDYAVVEDIRSLMGKCHVCGLVLNTGEIVSTAPCKVCTRCIITISIYNKWLPNEFVGVCSQCKGGQFAVKRKQASVKATQWACCESGGMEEAQLPCGHNVCRSHAKWITQCRACPKQV